MKKLRGCQQSMVSKMISRKELAYRLKALRIKSGLSMHRLGKKLNISRQAISKYELGDYRPKDDILQKYCAFFDIDMKYFIVPEISNIDNLYCDNISTTVTRNIKLLMHNNKHKIIDIADLLGVRPTTAGRYLNGKSSISLQQLSVIANFYNTPIVSLFA